MNEVIESVGPGQISGVVTGALSSVGLSHELIVVATAGIGIGCLIFGVKAAWTLFWLLVGDHYERKASRYE